jgi:uncharacterized caspase-like protein
VESDRQDRRKADPHQHDRPIEAPCKSCDRRRPAFFYYSGHAVKVDDELYLVPSDAYASDDADALLSVNRVKEILNSSEAKQKLMVLDACYSGADTSQFKAVPAQISNNFLQKYLAETKGAVILSSSENDQKSWASSPDSKLSLFTYYLLRALQGEAESLDGNKHLTLYSLHSYLSTREA